MNSWWRAYNEAMDDPKLQRLAPELFKHWFNLMCLASRQGGALPSIDDIAFALRISKSKAADVIGKLVDAKLLDDIAGVVTPHNWNGRQYKSDVSTGRVKQFRERKRNGAVNDDETFHH